MWGRRAWVVPSVAVLALACSRPASSENHDAAPGPSAAAAEPRETIGRARLAHPAESWTSFASMAGVDVKEMPSLEETFGVDREALALADTSKPVEVVLLGAANAPRVVTAWTPRAGEAGSKMPAGYRAKGVEGLGDVLEPEAPTTQRRCAILTAKAHLVCGASLEDVAQTARFISEKAAASGTETADLVVELSSTSAIQAFVPVLRDAVTERAKQFVARGTAAMQAKGTPVDAAAAAGLIAALDDGITTTGKDLRALTLRVNLSQTGLALEVEATIDPEGGSYLAEASKRHAGRPSSRKLGALFPTESASVFIMNPRQVEVGRRFFGFAGMIFDVVDTTDQAGHALWKHGATLFEAVGDTGATGTIWRDDGNQTIEVYPLKDEGKLARAALGAFKAERFDNGGVTIAVRPLEEAVVIVVEGKNGSRNAIAFALVAGHLVGVVGGESVEGTILEVRKRATSTDLPDVIAKASDGALIFGLDLARALRRPDARAPFWISLDSKTTPKGLTMRATGGAANESVRFARDLVSAPLPPP